LSATDAVTAYWDAKLHYGFRRPGTAVLLAAEDGNPATEPDPARKPLIETPPRLLERLGLGLRRRRPGRGVLLAPDDLLPILAWADGAGQAAPGATGAAAVP
jgi:hypothetical protein